MTVLITFLFKKRSDRQWECSLEQPERLSLRSPET